MNLNRQLSFTTHLQNQRIWRRQPKIIKAQQIFFRQGAEPQIVYMVNNSRDNRIIHNICPIGRKYQMLLTNYGEVIYTVGMTTPEVKPTICPKTAIRVRTSTIYHHRSQTIVIVGSSDHCLHFYRPNCKPNQLQKPILSRQLNQQISQVLCLGQSYVYLINMERNKIYTYDFELNRMSLLYACQDSNDRLMLRQRINRIDVITYPNRLGEQLKHQLLTISRGQQPNLVATVPVIINKLLKQDQHENRKAKFIDFCYYYEQSDSLSSPQQQFHQPLKRFPPKYLSILTSPPRQTHPVIYIYNLSYNIFETIFMHLKDIDKIYLHSSHQIYATNGQQVSIWNVQSSASKQVDQVSYRKWSQSVNSVVVMIRLENQEGGGRRRRLSSKGEAVEQ